MGKKGLAATVRIVWKDGLNSGGDGDLRCGIYVLEKLWMRGEMMRYVIIGWRGGDNKQIFDIGEWTVKILFFHENMCLYKQ
jgi:hypothetical protein